jgi:ferritin-like metal-binding protein YciE
LKAWAGVLGLDEVAALFNETLREEKEADQKLSNIAGKVMTKEEPMSATRGR